MSIFGGGRRADLLVVAVGNPELVQAHWVKPGAVVLDVGINVVEGEDGESRVVGDVAFEEVSQVAGEKPWGACRERSVPLFGIILY
jgi:5,10-methylene-tetrahydrofolate dehydrogenase/methenyl tetrahydrofolate cyclohydrolase